MARIPYRMRYGRIMRYADCAGFVMRYVMRYVITDAGYSSPRYSDLTN